MVIRRRNRLRTCGWHFQSPKGHALVGVRSEAMMYRQRRRTSFVDGETFRNGRRRRRKQYSERSVVLAKSS